MMIAAAMIPTGMRQPRISVARDRVPYGARKHRRIRFGVIRLELERLGDDISLVEFARDFFENHFGEFESDARAR
jgi:hypothetical protein